MLVNLQTILKDTDKGYAVPAFNVYNMETVMGVISAAEEERSPVILQFYSRLATTGFADYLAPVILKAAEKASVPVCMHLDHGAGIEAAAISLNILEFPNAKVRVFRPILSAEERERRMKIIHDAAADLLKSIEVRA